jgi:acyl-coenzyme A thioesterase PaaI-like protein
MIDIAMAHAAIAKGRLRARGADARTQDQLPRAGRARHGDCEGRVLRWGGSVGFLDGDLRDGGGRLIIHATCTVKIVRPKR